MVKQATKWVTSFLPGICRSSKVRCPTILDWYLQNPQQRALFSDIQHNTRCQNRNILSWICERTAQWTSNKKIVTGIIFTGDSVFCELSRPKLELRFTRHVVKAQAFLTPKWNSHSFVALINLTTCTQSALVHNQTLSYLNEENIWAWQIQEHSDKQTSCFHNNRTTNMTLHFLPSNWKRQKSFATPHYCVKMQNTSGTNVAKLWFQFGLIWARYENPEQPLWGSALEHLVSSPARRNFPYLRYVQAHIVGTGQTTLRSHFQYIPRHWTLLPGRVWNRKAQCEMCIHNIILPKRNFMTHADTLRSRRV